MARLSEASVNLPAEEASPEKKKKHEELPQMAERGIKDIEEAQVGPFRFLIWRQARSDNVADTVLKSAGLTYLAPSQ